MPKYEIEMYELCTSSYLVEAKNEAEAIKKQFDGDGERIDNSPEYIETAEEYGMPVAGNEDLADALIKLGVRINDDFIPSIRQIVKVD